MANKDEYNCLLLTTQVTVTLDMGWLLARVCDLAVGCGKLRTPAGGWVRRGADDVTLVGCDASPEQWKLRCYGNAWMTQSGDTAANINCTQGTPLGSCSLQLVVTFRENFFDSGFWRFD